MAQVFAPLVRVVRPGGAPTEVFPAPSLFPTPIYSGSYQDFPTGTLYKWDGTSQQVGGTEDTTQWADGVYAFYHVDATADDGFMTIVVDNGNFPAPPYDVPVWYRTGTRQRWYPSQVPLWVEFNGRVHPDPQPLTYEEAVPPYTGVPVVTPLNRELPKRYEDVPAWFRTLTGGHAVNVALTDNAKLWGKHWAYFPDELELQLEVWDGPRGDNNLSEGMCITPDPASPDVIVGDLYTGRICRVKPDGEVITVHGWRNKRGVLPYEHHDNDSIGPALTADVKLTKEFVGPDSDPAVRVRGPYDIHFAPGETTSVYVADFYRDQITRVNLTTGATELVQSVTDPTGVQFDDSGGMWVTSGNELMLDGVVQYTGAAAVELPRIDSQGRVVFYEGFEGMRWNPATSSVESLHPDFDRYGNGDLPTQGFAIDRNGVFGVVDGIIFARAHGVNRYLPDGTMETFVEDSDGGQGGANQPHTQGGGSMYVLTTCIDDAEAKMYASSLKRGTLIMYQPGAYTVPDETQMFRGQDLYFGYTGPQKGISEVLGRSGYNELGLPTFDIMYNWDRTTFDNFFLGGAGTNEPIAWTAAELDDLWYYVQNASIYGRIA